MTTLGHSAHQGSSGNWTLKRCWRVRCYRHPKSPAPRRDCPTWPTEAEIRAFYDAVWKARRASDVIVIKTLLYIGVRVAELVRIRLAYVVLAGLPCRPKLRPGLRFVHHRLVDARLFDLGAPLGVGHSFDLRADSDDHVPDLGHLLEEPGPFRTDRLRPGFRFGRRRSPRAGGCPARPTMSRCRIPGCRSPSRRPSRQCDQAAQDRGKDGPDGGQVRAEGFPA